MATQMDLPPKPKLASWQQTFNRVTSDRYNRLLITLAFFLVSRPLHGQESFALLTVAWITFLLAVLI
ncbi:MAG: hypothetical protein AAGF24_07495, partial [Cyanobacteria bacterium P01_H01_bin.121]